MWENFASQAGWVSLGSTVTPGMGWLLETPASLSQPFSRYALAKEGCGLAQREHLAGAQWQSSQLGPLINLFSEVPMGVGGG